MIDHVSYSVHNFKESCDFYDQTLEALGYRRLILLDKEGLQVAGYGKDNKPCFWIGESKELVRQDEEIGHARGLHIAFQAPDAESVDRWYEKCLELKAKDNGKPGTRPQYHPGYYGGFVIDPNGWRIEACVHNYKES